MTKKERLDKILSNMGYGSRKDVQKIIKEGRVNVNNHIIIKKDFKVDPYEDIITVDGNEVKYRKYIYIMMNKPQDVVSSTDDPINKTVLDIIDERYLIFNPFPVGRLDKDTEGLLLLTNDGKFAHEILSPKKGIEKTYYAEIYGLVEEKHKEYFKQGIVLDDGYKTLPADLEILESNTYSKVKLSIKEGKYHQVKRMFEAIDMEVVYLKRISIGLLKLDETLNSGEYRELTKEEIRLLKEKF
ncbi:16S rRNA pseudouridine516 synthase [Keratinibaculum paraultunense]|uniref:Pseudouridine synthase n=1 Tax=Keratinibaculum paraultunense TaxID=1278232 RepID=A0A4R3KZ58_9FIRM|nr:pseudouridine synthase [Keratinibaculum paraultunense]QQY78992.1 rRNA pseudouridine synthase [Keratinibaculum paraultunense]TCS90614.1 16S rRNA pseudouridine516 synthase [Keratinibaculum paraultunense]